MIEKLKSTPKSLVKSATFIDDEKILVVEKLIEKLSQQTSQTAERNAETTEANTNGHYKEKHSVFLTHASPSLEGKHASEKLLLKSKFYPFLLYL